MMEEPAGAEPGATVKVLLVDDSPTQLLYYRHLLEQEGWAVRAAASGAEALLRFAEDRPGLVVSDCDMPLVDGFQLCRLLKDDPASRQVPVLLLTGTRDRLDRFWCRTCGADRYLVKGGAPGELLGAVRELVQAGPGPGAAREGAGPRRPLHLEDLARQLSRSLEHRLLEATVRNAVAALGAWIREPARVAWGFLDLLQDLVAPGAIYFLCPNATGHTCHLRAGSALDPARRNALLAPLAALSYLPGAPPVEERGLDWEPEGAAEVGIRHFPLGPTTCGVRAQWGLLAPGAVLRSHANLFLGASAELERLVQEMASLVMLEAANRKLTEADAAKTAFVLTLSHDLRSPLGALQLGLEAVERSRAAVPDEVRNWLEIGRGTVDRLIRLVNGVLDLGRMESGSFSFQPVRVDAAALARESRRSLEPLAAARKVRLAQAPEPGGAFWILVDPDRFQQILVNLLANAIKFSPSPGLVRLDLRRRGGEVVVSVRDQGPGVPGHFRTRIFGKFQQAERKASGSGLGLAIARQLTESMGGRIGFCSEEGRGACFEVAFPAVPGPA